MLLNLDLLPVQKTGINVFVSEGLVTGMYCSPVGLVAYAYDENYATTSPRVRLPAEASLLPFCPKQHSQRPVTCVVFEVHAL